MEGYRCKQYNNLRILIKESLVSTHASGQWQDMCLGLFHDQKSSRILKTGTYKTILKAGINGGSCIVKKYRNRGWVRSIKSLFWPSKAKQEFQSAVYIHGKGIPTPAPLFMAELRTRGIVRESLIALPFLSAAKELRELFFYEHSLSLSEKREILAGFGKLTANIFQHGVFQYDYSLNNFMAQKEGLKHKIYFIDFERVEIKKELSEDRKIGLLAKLNRVGRQISIGDRIRFLKNYMAADPGIAGSFKDLACKVQQKTVMVLKRDLLRCRLTSIYTHGSYDKLKANGYTGLYKKGYDPNDIFLKIKAIAEGSLRGDVAFKFRGSESILSTVQLKGDGAEKTWSSLSTLIITGLPLELPHILIQGGRRGFIMFAPAAEEAFRRFKKTDSRLHDFIKKNFPEALERTGKLFA